MNQEKVWDKIAESWNSFRQSKFTDTKEFFESFCTSRKGRVLDIGCGNARNLLPFYESGFDCYGVDFSSEMLKIAKQFCMKKKLKCTLKKADMRKLPFRNDFFDVCIMAQSLHNLEKNPEKALEEMNRVMKKGSIGFVSVWNKWQKRFFFSKKDVIIPWKKGKKIYLRYYHLYDYFELRKMIRNAGFKILSSKPFHKNLVFIIKKK